MNRKRISLMLPALLALCGCNPSSPQSTMPATANCMRRPPDDQIAAALAQSLGGQPGSVTIMGFLPTLSCHQYSIIFTSTVQLIQAFGPAKYASGAAELDNTDNGRWFVMQGIAAPVEVTQ